MTNNKKQLTDAEKALDSVEDHMYHNEIIPDKDIETIRNALQNAGKVDGLLAALVCISEYSTEPEARMAQDAINEFNKGK